jgi:hypothetical protein
MQSERPEYRLQQTLGRTHQETNRQMKERTKGTDHEHKLEYLPSR